MTDILRYRGDIVADVRAADAAGHMWGPDIHGRLLAMRKVAFDPAANTTVVTMRGILPTENRERVEALIAQQASPRARIRALFCG